MRSLTRAAVVIGSLVTLGLAVWLLPRASYTTVRAGVPSAPTTVNLTWPEAPGHDGLPNSDSATFVPVLREAGRVSAGDTIGLAYGSLQRRTRRRLLDMVEAGVIDPLALPAPRGLRMSLRALRETLQPAVVPAPTPRTQSGAYVVTGGERDLLESELMGAEDALAEFSEALRSQSKADGAEADPALVGKVSTKRRVVADLRARLSERHEHKVTAPTPSAAATATSVLDHRARTKLLQLAEGLPKDRSLAILAQVDGTYTPVVSRTQDVRTGEVLGTLHPGALNSMTPPDDTAASYYLVAEGSPALWAKAKRVKTRPERPEANVRRVTVRH